MPLDSPELLRQATALKDSGDINAAIAALKKAYELIAEAGEEQLIETFLRLPLYLQAAGRADEAWQEFHRLLSHGNPNRSLNEHDKSVIYDKMRLCAQREKKDIDAVVYGVLSYIHDLRGRYVSGLSDPLFMQYYKQYSAPEKFSSILITLLKKSHRLDQLDGMRDLLAASISHIPKGDEVALESSVRQILKKDVKEHPVT